MKRALVLSGGGSRGAYEIGAWKALRELGVRIDGVYGTSIGALNAALVARGDLDAAQRLWQDINISRILTVEDPEDFAIERMVSNKRDVIPFLVENAKHLRMDITPLEQMVAAECDEAAIRRSGMDFGVMTFKVPQLQGVPVRLSDMAPDSVGDWVIASASCFPIFPARHIGTQRYIDGGYYDNLPIDMALRDGASEVIAVELHPYDTHPEYARMPWLKIVRPRHGLGGFLDFNPRLMRRSLLLGYQDTMKVYHRFDGWLYTFRRVDALAVAEVARRFMCRVTTFDGECVRRGALYAGQPVNTPLLNAIESETGFERLAWKDVWLRGLELAAEAVGYRVDAIYDAGALIRQLRGFCETVETPSRLDDEVIEKAAQQGERQLFAVLVRWLEARGDYPANVIQRLGAHPRAAAGALFMHTLAVLNV